MWSISLWPLSDPRILHDPGGGGWQGGLESFWPCTGHTCSYWNCLVGCILIRVQQIQQWKFFFLFCLSLFFSSCFIPISILFDRQRTSVYKHNHFSITKWLKRHSFWLWHSRSLPVWQFDQLEPDVNQISTVLSVHWHK